jgi:N6-adenosine-specific RNA methylase IME4/transcriptional regulator with XRE-family HTH domain
MSAAATGARIRALREAAGLGQRELAAILGADQPWVSKWESGARAPGPDMLARLASALATTVDDLMGLGQPPAMQAALESPAGRALAAGDYYEAGRLAIAAARTADAASDIADKAEAMRVYAHRALDHELEANAAEIRIRAERRLGEILAAARKAGQLAEGRPKNGSAGERFSRVRLAEIGVSRKLSMRSQDLARIAWLEFEDRLGRWRRGIERDGEKVTTRLVRAETKRERREAREGELAARIRALPDKVYGVIYADPPWRFEPRSRETGMDRAADNHYPTLPVDRIAALAVPGIAAADSALFLWATMPFLAAAIGVMDAWGFRYKSHTVWRKVRPGAAAGGDDAGRRAPGRHLAGLFIGPGYWFREAHEILVLGTRGKVPAPAMGDQWPSVIDAPPRRHSEKPEVFAEMIEDYFPTLPRIELFARRARPGWDAWGNEVPGNQVSGNQVSGVGCQVSGDQASGERG